MTVEIDTHTASIIAAAMRAVALADGRAHEAELALIREFEADLPDDIDVTAVHIVDDAVRDVLLRSMFSVALADGRISDEERAVLVEIARAHGATDERIAQIEVEVCREFVRELAGVELFRDEAVTEAVGLGLDPEEALRVLDGDDAEYDEP